LKPGIKKNNKKTAGLFDAREHKQSMERFVHLNGSFIAQGSLHPLDGLRYTLGFNIWRECDMDADSMYSTTITSYFELYW